MFLPRFVSVRVLSRLGRGSSAALSRFHYATNITHPSTVTRGIRCFCRGSSRGTRNQGYQTWPQLKRSRTGGSRGEQGANGGRGGQHRTNAPLMAKMGSGAGAAALGTAAFVQLSEEDSGDDNETGEDRMLAASRREIAKKIQDDDRGLSRLRHQVVLLLDLYVWEPLCTGFRFLHLAAIFVPVILAVPAVWVGRRVPQRDNERTGTLWWYGLLVKSMELAGPAFIKLGQWAASRSDIFPNEMCDTMSRLHSNAPAHSLHATRRIVEAAFNGMPFDSIFDEFDETPLGVGAIAQVYRAKLKPGLASPADVDVGGGGGGRGRRRGISVRKKVETVLKSTPKRVPSSYVAVKVLHPRVERTVRRDLRIMGFFAAAINAIPTMHWLSLPDEVAQFGEMMRLQLDLRIEAANLTVFRNHFRDRSTAWFPFPYPEFTTRNVLIEEFATGIPLADFMENGSGVFQHDIAAEGLDAFLRMLLIDNFVHADLHPGNIMVRFYQAEKPGLPNFPNLPHLQRHSQRGAQEVDGEHGDHGDHGDHDDHNTPAGRQQLDVTEQVLSRLRPYRHRKDKAAWEEELRRIDEEGFRPQLLFIDTGLVTELNATNRRNFLDLFRAVAEFDGYKAGALMCERCRQPDAVLDADVFALKMQHLVLEVKSSTLALGNVRIGDILQRVLAMVRAHHVRMEGDFVNVVISIFLLEGIGRALNPDLDLLSSALPILRELSAQSGADMVKQGDFSMIMVWVGLEARRFMQASIEDVERCVKYDQLSPNI
ncbi:hypothetical protein RB595_006286 [Gaeumannomyces hyphopodioides]